MIHKHFDNRDAFLAHLVENGFEFTEHRFPGSGVYGEVRIEIPLGEWIAYYEVSDYTGQVIYCGAFSLDTGKVTYSYNRRCILERRLKLAIE